MVRDRFGTVAAIVSGAAQDAGRALRRAMKTTVTGIRAHAPALLRRPSATPQTPAPSVPPPVRADPVALPPPTVTAIATKTDSQDAATTTREAGNKMVKKAAPPKSTARKQSTAAAKKTAPAKAASPKFSPAETAPPRTPLQTPADLDVENQPGGPAAGGRPGDSAP